jgi:hypothetical protein
MQHVSEHSPAYHILHSADPVPAPAPAPQVPHLHAVVNNVRVATQASIFYCSILLLFLGFLPGVDPEAEEDVYKFRQQITYAMWGGLIPTFIVGWLLGMWRQAWFKRKVCAGAVECPCSAHTDRPACRLDCLLPWCARDDLFSAVDCTAAAGSGLPARTA